MRETTSPTIPAERILDLDDNVPLLHARVRDSICNHADSAHTNSVHAHSAHAYSVHADSAQTDSAHAYSGHAIVRNLFTQHHAISHATRDPT
eukprot:gene10915-biopygen773